MPVVPTLDILSDAFENRYGVAAINVVNDLTMEAVLAAAVKADSPIIIQTSVKTVRSIGISLLFAMWKEMTSDIPVPVSLHLDHCPDRRVISECLVAGWNSVLFDASTLPVAENQRQTIEVVREARDFGAHVEGEIESITGVEDDIGSDQAAHQQDLSIIVNFIESTGVDFFAPSIGNAHGIYKSEPKLDSQRVTDIVDAVGVPIALHGGSGMSDDQFTDLIQRGCAKINISTALKITYMQTNLEFLRGAEVSGKWDPPSLFESVRAGVEAMATDHIRRFGSDGKASRIVDC